MASKKFLELSEMTVESLNEEMSAAQNELSQLNFDHNSKGIANPKQISILKKDIARLKTEIRRREITSMSAEEVAKRSKIRLRRRIAK